MVSDFLVQSSDLLDLQIIGLVGGHEKLPKAALKPSIWCILRQIQYNISDEVDNYLYISKLPQHI